MRTIAVLQNTDSEHLGLVEDHLEGRNIRFRYVRPAHDSDWVRKAEMPKDGLILLGAAPYGTVSEPKMPLIDHKMRITEACLRKNLPILAFGTGAQLLCLALGGKVEQSEMRLSVDSAYRTFDEALNGYLPQQYPVVNFMRDTPGAPPGAVVLSESEDGRPLLFQAHDNCLGFSGHPGIKSAMIEDAIVQAPGYDFGNTEALNELRQCQEELENTLVSMMTGIIQITGWMREQQSVGQ